jgi:hypothetical protein
VSRLLRQLGAVTGERVYVSPSAEE